MSVRQKAKAYEAAVANSPPMSGRKISGGEASRDEERSGSSIPVAPPRKMRKRVNTESGSSQEEKKKNNPKLALPLPKERTQSVGKKPQRPPPPKGTQDKTIKIPPKKPPPPVKPKPQLPPKPKHLQGRYSKPVSNVHTGLVAADPRAEERDVCRDEQKKSESSVTENSNLSCEQLDPKAAGKDGSVLPGGKIIAETRPEIQDGSGDGSVVNGRNGTDSKDNLGVCLETGVIPCNADGESKVDTSVEGQVISFLSDKTESEDLGDDSRREPSDKEQSSAASERPSSQDDLVRDESGVASAVASDERIAAVDENEQAIPVPAVVESERKLTPSTGVGSEDLGREMEDTAGSGGKVEASTCRPPAEETTSEVDADESEETADVGERNNEIPTFNADGNMAVSDVRIDLGGATDQVEQKEDSNPDLTEQSKAECAETHDETSGTFRGEEAELRSIAPEVDHARSIHIECAEDSVAEVQLAPSAEAGLEDGRDILLESPSTDQDPVKEQEVGVSEISTAVDTPIPTDPEEPTPEQSEAQRTPAYSASEPQGAAEGNSGAGEYISEEVQTSVRSSSPEPIREDRQLAKQNDEETVASVGEAGKPESEGTQARDAKQECADVPPSVWVDEEEEAECVSKDPTTAQVTVPDRSTEQHGEAVPHSESDAGLAGPASEVPADGLCREEFLVSEREGVSESQEQELQQEADLAPEQQLIVDDENLEQHACEPEPTRPSRPNRAQKLRKHHYEDVQGPPSQAQSRVQEELYEVPRPQPSSESDSGVPAEPYKEPVDYDVPSAVFSSPVKPFGSTARAPEAEYSVPCTPFSDKPGGMVPDCEYDVPRVSSGSRENYEPDEDQETYAVPSPVVRAIPSQQTASHTEVVYAVPQEKGEESIPSQETGSHTEAVYAVPQEKGEESIPSQEPASHTEAVYAVPQEKGEESIPSQDPASHTEAVYAVPQEKGEESIPSQEPASHIEAVYAVPQEKTEAALRDASAPASSSSKKRPAPPKPPRSSSLRGKRITVVKREDLEKGSDAAVSTESQEEQDSQQRPVPKPRSYTPPVGPDPSDAACPADNPVPEERADDVAEAPVARPRSQQLSGDNRPLTPVTRRHTGPTEDAANLEGGVARKAPPPRPPPPAVEKRSSSLPPLDLSASDAQRGRGDSSLEPPVSPGVEEDLAASSESDSDGEDTLRRNKAREAGGPPRTKTFHIAHEILTTEQTFVNALKLVFEDCYGTIKSADAVPESVLNDIFKDLENIYLLDSKFLQELEDRMRTWEETQRIGDIIKKYSHFLKMYTQYVNGYDKSMAVLQETMSQNLPFSQLVKQFQASERCQGLMLNSFMLKPVQRIPSYRLLLIDYLKHLPETSEEHQDIGVALKIVSEVATHINDSMKKMDRFEQILKIQSRLVGQHEIVKAGRDFIKEGMLSKLCRKDLQPRMFFLLTDVLLYCSPVGGGNQFKLVRKLPLLGMKVTLPDSPDFVNEFSIISTTRSFTLTASTPEERDEWIMELNNAISVVTERKKTFLSEKDKDKDAIQLVDDSRLGQTAPVWIPDSRATMCMLCTVAFTVTNRRHHCRACGRVVCNSCSDNLAPLVYLDYNQARVCDKCYETLLKDFHKDEQRGGAEPSSPPLMQESDEALEKLHRKPTKFEMMTRFKSRRRKRQSKIIRPAVLTEVEGAEEGRQMSGYLRCKKGNKGWKRMWFVLKDRVLYTYKASSDVAANETLPVLGYEVEATNRDNEEFAFQLKHKGVTPMYFKAENDASKARWIEELKKATKLA